MFLIVAPQQLGSSQDQRLAQHQQVLNRARDILRSNSTTSNGNSSFPKRPRLDRKRYSVQTVKEFCKTVLVLAPSNEHSYHLTSDQILGHAEVDFTTEDSESTVRAKIVQAVEQLAHDIKPDDFEFVKVQSKRVSVPFVASGHKWDFKHVKNLCGQGKIYIRLLSYLTEQEEKDGTCMSTNTEVWVTIQEKSTNSIPNSFHSEVIIIK